MPPGAQPEEREGLPADYHMRHDRHYVEQLFSPAANVPISLVSVNDIAAPPRDPDRLGPLIESIRAVGVLQPLLVRSRAGRYELIGGAKRLAAAAAAGLSHVPCRAYDGDDARTELLAEADNLRAGGGRDQTAPAASPGTVVPQALKELDRSVTTLRACLTLLSENVRPSFHKVLRGLSDAELQRLEGLLEAFRILSDEQVPVAEPVRLDILVQGVADRFAPERKLAGVALAAHGLPVVTLHADPRLLRAAIVGAVGAMTALAQDGGADSPRLEIRLCQTWMRTATFEITERPVVPSRAVLEHFFDHTKADRPGGTGAAIGLAAARRVAQLYDGRAEAEEIEDGGCRLRLTLRSL